MNEDILEINLNELVTKQVADKISKLEKELKSARDKNDQQYQEIFALKKTVDDSKIALGLLEHIRNQFSQIKQTEKDKDGFGFKSKQQNQFLFIESVLLNIFNIKKEANGWYCSGQSGNLATHLAINFYSNKDKVIDILCLIMPDCSREISFIKSFKMPFDYPKEDVIAYVKAPKYNTNGCIFGITSYWMEYGAAKLNMPHDLIMRNPHIIEEDVFSILIESIRKKVPESSYLFALPKYNSKVSKEQVVKLGECLIDNNIKFSDTMAEFVSQNIKDFNSETLEFLFTKVQSDNQYKALHWEKFPNEYQMRFLESKPLDEVLKLITSYNCTWTIEQKETFLKRSLCRTS